MTLITVPAADICPGDILCNAAGAPCARVSDVIGTEESCVWVSAYSLDDQTWFPVTFDVGEEAVVVREAARADSSSDVVSIDLCMP